MKAQQFFGGTKPKKTGEPARQAHYDISPKGKPFASASGNPSGYVNTRGQADTKAYKPKTGPFYRPDIKGKVDNRKVGQ